MLTWLHYKRLLALFRRYCIYFKNVFAFRMFQRLNWILFFFQGLRPKIPKKTHPKVKGLLQRCWNQDPKDRPEFEEIIEMLQQIMIEVNVVPSWWSELKKEKPLRGEIYQSRMWWWKNKQVGDEDSGKDKQRLGFLQATLKRPRY